MSLDLVQRRWEGSRAKSKLGSFCIFLEKDLDRYLSEKNIGPNSEGGGGGIKAEFVPGQNLHFFSFFWTASLKLVVCWNETRLVLRSLSIREVF